MEPTCSYFPVQTCLSLINIKMEIQQEQSPNGYFPFQCSSSLIFIGYHIQDRTTHFLRFYYFPSPTYLFYKIYAWQKDWFLFILAWSPDWSFNYYCLLFKSQRRCSNFIFEASCQSVYQFHRRNLSVIYEEAFDIDIIKIV